MTDETKSKEGEAVENSEEQTSAAQAEEKVTADKAVAKEKKEEKVVEQVEQHKTDDIPAAIAKLIERVAKLESRPATKVYLKSRKENSDGVQAKVPQEGTAVKGKRGKIRLWRTF